jgi:hypothetical protein
MNTTMAEVYLQVRLRSSLVSIIEADLLSLFPPRHYIRISPASTHTPAFFSFEEFFLPLFAFCSDRGVGSEESRTYLFICAKHDNKRASDAMKIPWEHNKRSEGAEEGTTASEWEGERKSFSCVDSKLLSTRMENYFLLSLEFILKDVTRGSDD